MIHTRIHVVGSGAGKLEPNLEGSCYVVNRRLMIDLGWGAALQMPRVGVHAREINTVILTHAHADHVLGLPQLLYFRFAGRPAPPVPLNIIGLDGIVQKVVEGALAFLQSTWGGTQSAVHVIPLAAGDTWEDEAFKLETCSALHTVSGLCLRLTDRQSEVELAFSGDTSYNADLVQLSRDADVLFHEATLGARATVGDRSGHSGGREAALTAQQANVGRLFLTHIPSERRLPALTEALSIFPNTAVLQDGDIIDIVSRKFYGPEDER